MWKSLCERDVLLLNPTLGASAEIVGRADADAIAGDLLIDLKTTMKDRIDVEDLDQLLGYRAVSSGAEDEPRLSEHTASKTGSFSTARSSALT